jgi:hypothetical protein
MYLVAIAWIYVVLMMAVVEALSSQGTVIGAVFTFLLYGALPLSIVLYVMGTPLRLKARRAADAAVPPSTGPAPDGGDEPAGAAVAPKREEA